MKHTIGIQVINSPAGVPSPTDGVCMMFIQAIAVANTFALETPYPLEGPDDLAALGINPAYDLANALAVYQQVTEFYEEAQEGALLWLVGVATNTAFTAYVAGQNFSNHIEFTAQADPAQRAKLVGLCYAPPANVQTAADFPADVTNAIAAMQTAQEALFNLGYQFGGIIDGYNMSATVTSAAIGTMATKACPSIQLCMTGSKGNGVSAVGAALGRYARISIGHGVGAVADGPRTMATAFLTNGIALYPGTNLTANDTYLVQGGTVTYNGATYQTGQSFIAQNGILAFTTADTGFVVYNSTPVQSLKQSDIDNYGSKQYFFLRTWFNHSGFYWNDGATCDDPTETLSTMEYTRVANNLSAAALSYFIDQIGQNLPLDTSTGAVAQSVLNAMQSQFYVQSIGPLSVANGSGDITDGALILSAPNFNATRTINFKIKIVPTPILGDVDGTVEFDATL